MWRKARRKRSVLVRDLAEGELTEGLLLENKEDCVDEFNVFRDVVELVAISIALPRRM